MKRRSLSEIRRRKDRDLDDFDRPCVTITLDSAAVDAWNAGFDGDDVALAAFGNVRSSVVIDQAAAQVANVLGRLGVIIATAGSGYAVEPNPPPRKQMRSQNLGASHRLADGGPSLTIEIDPKHAKAWLGWIDARLAEISVVTPRCAHGQLEEWLASGGLVCRSCRVAFEAQQIEERERLIAAGVIIEPPRPALHSVPPAVGGDAA